MIKAVLFDLDGTLLDTERIYNREEMLSAAELGYDFFKREDALDMRSLYRAGCIKLMASRYGDAFDYDRYHKLMKEKFAAAIERDGIPLKPGIDVIVSYLKKHEPERLEEFQGEDPKKLFFEKEGNAAQYYERLRSKRLKKAVEVIKQRIDILQKKKDKDDYETKEAERLNDYLKLLDHDMRGELVYDKKKAKRVKDTQFDKRYKFIDARDIELFPEEPMLSDVIQGNIGNCYLIAALGSVVESDPGFIKRHMKDNGDGTVTVRVYHGDTMSEKYDPIEVTVDKSVAYNEKGKPIGTQGALWVNSTRRRWLQQV